MLIAIEIIQTVHKHSKMTVLDRGGEVFRFVLSLGNCPNIFGQDCSNKFFQLRLVTVDHNVVLDYIIFLLLFISKVQNQAVSLAEPG